MIALTEELANQIEHITRDQLRVVADRLKASCGAFLLEMHDNDRGERT